MTEPDSENRAEIRALTAVSRAAGELRRGRAVIVLSSGGDGGGITPALAVRAAETLSEVGLAELAAWGGGPTVLALTMERARVLAMPRPVTAAVLVAVDQDWGADMVQALADPTADLAHSLRGPFERAAEAPGRCHEAALALCKAARLLPAALAVTLPVSPTPGAAGGASSGAVAGWAAAHDLLIVETAQIEAHQAQDGALTEVAAAHLPLANAGGGTIEATIHAYRPGDGGPEHLAIVIGDPARSAPVLTRIHSECFTGDLLGSLRCDCGEQLRGAIREIEAAGGGILLYLAQEGRGIGLINKLRAYALQDQGFDTVEANLRLGFAADERIFVPAAVILRTLGFGRVRLMTNNPDKVTGLERCGLEVSERVPHAFPANDHNAYYLSTKAKKSGHLL